MKRSGQISESMNALEDYLQTFLQFKKEERTTMNNSMQSGRRALCVLASLAMMGQLGCSKNTENTENMSCGAQGSAIEISSQTLCVYKQEIVIETGFSCPDAHPYRQDFEGFTTCSAQEENLDAMQVDEVRGEINDKLGWDVKKPGSEIDPNLRDMGPGSFSDMSEGREDMGPGSFFDQGLVEDMSPGVVVTSDRIDLLMVVDNSFSMCRKQARLRADVGDLIASVQDRDFQIGVTTTHAPASGISIEPVAQRARLQSTPQPVPGNSIACIGDSSDGFAALRASLADAVTCLKEDVSSSDFVWTDAQIECALRSTMAQNQSGCVVSSGLPDRNGDALYNVFDLFPDTEDYRAIPLVLRRGDYEDVQGVFDATSFEADLNCALQVGTRGDGYEKGLLAAVEAVSPAFTGSVEGSVNADSSAPNHGLIRENSKFGLLFFSDENDCSHGGTLTEVGNACGANICEYQNSEQLADEDSLLFSPSDLAGQLLSNLSNTKGVPVAREDVYVASIVGTAQRYAQAPPSCDIGPPDDISPVCSTPLGDAYSGDRYMRFMEQFPNQLPNMGPVQPGVMCGNEYGTILSSFGQALAQ